MLSSDSIAVALNAIEEWKIPATDSDMQAVLVAKHELRAEHQASLAREESEREAAAARAAAQPTAGPSPS